MQNRTSWRTPLPLQWQAMFRWTRSIGRRISCYTSISSWGGWGSNWYCGRGCALRRRWNRRKRHPKRNSGGGQRKNEDDDEVHQFSPEMMISPSGLTFEAIQTPIMARTSSSSPHYTQLKKTPQSLFGPPTPSQSSCDNHPFFERLILFLMIRVPFLNDVLAIESDIL